MTYPDISTVNATNDLSNLLVYANEVTNGLFAPGVLLAFFIIILIAGFFAQMRFKGSTRFDFSFTAAGFATFGFAVIMSLKTGLLNPIYLFISLAVAILGVVWIYLASE